MAPEDTLLYKAGCYIREEGVSVLMNFSHLCLVFSVKLANLSDDSKRGLFVLQHEGQKISTEQWCEAFQFSLSYKLQFVLLGEEQEPFFSHVKLTKKDLIEDELVLEFEYQGEDEKGLAPLLPKEPTKISALSEAASSASSLSSKS